MKKVWDREGIPSTVRGEVWRLAIGNGANVPPNAFDECVPPSDSEDESGGDESGSDHDDSAAAGGTEGLAIAVPPVPITAGSGSGPASKSGGPTSAGAEEGGGSGIAHSLVSTTSVGAGSGAHTTSADLARQIERDNQESSAAAAAAAAMKRTGSTASITSLGDANASGSSSAAVSRSASALSLNGMDGGSGGGGALMLPAITTSASTGDLAGLERALNDAVSAEGTTTGGGGAEGGAKQSVLRTSSMTDLSSAAKPTDHKPVTNNGSAPPQQLAANTSGALKKSRSSKPPKPQQSKTYRARRESIEADVARMGPATLFQLDRPLLPTTSVTDSSTADQLTSSESPEANEVAAREERAARHTYQLRRVLEAYGRYTALQNEKAKSAAAGGGGGSSGGGGGGGSGVYYVQGMSYLASILLLHQPTAPDRVLVCLINLLRRDYFVAYIEMDAPLIRSRFAIFDSILHESLPQLCAHLKHIQIAPDFYLMEWLMTLFSKPLRPSVASRAWDWYLLHGEAAVYRPAVAILRVLEPKLMACGINHALRLLSTHPLAVSEPELVAAYHSIHLSQSATAAIAALSSSNASSIAAAAAAKK